jgi:hypothetical protein
MAERTRPTLAGLYSPQQVAEMFGQHFREDMVITKKKRDGTREARVVHRKGDPDVRWVYRHADRHGLLHRAARRHKGTRAVLFDRAEIEAIMAEFEAPETQRQEEQNDGRAR